MELVTIGLAGEWPSPSSNELECFPLNCPSLRERFRSIDKLQPLHCPAVAYCHILPSSSLSVPALQSSPSKTETSSAKPLSLPSQSILFFLSVSLGSNPTSHFISFFPFSFLADQRKRFYRIYSINRCNLTPLFLSAELQALPIPLSLSPLSYLLVLPLLGASGSVCLLQPCTLGKTKRRSLPRDFCFCTSCGTLLWRLVLCMWIRVIGMRCVLEVIKEWRSKRIDRKHKHVSDYTGQSMLAISWTWPTEIRQNCMWTENWKGTTSCAIFSMSFKILFKSNKAISAAIRRLGSGNDASQTQIKAAHISTTQGIGVDINKVFLHSYCTSVHSSEYFLFCIIFLLADQ